MRRALVVLLLVLSVGGAGTGVVAARHERHERQQEQRRAEQVAEKKAYTESLKPVLVLVYDAIQPVEDTQDADAQVLADVVIGAGAVRQVDEAAKALARLKVPADYVDEVALLEEELRVFRSVLTDAGKAARTFLGGGDAAPLNRAMGLLVQAEARWATLLAPLFEGQPYLAPLSGSKDARQRVELTRGALIRQMDEVCLEGAIKISAIREPAPGSGVGAYRTYLVDTAEQTDRVLQRLKQQPGLKGEEVSTRQLRRQLTAATDFTAQARALAGRIAARDERGALEAQQRLISELQSLERLSAAYKTIGATYCVRFFAVGDEGQGTSSA